MRSIKRARPILGDPLLKKFARFLREQDLSPATLRGYLHDVKRFRQWVEAGHRGVALERITTVDLVNYRQHLLRTERLKAATINRKLQALKKLFGWGRQRNYVKANPASEVRFVRVGERLRPRGLREAEVQALLRAAGQTRHGLARRDYALVEVLLETGLRVAEAADLRLGDLEIHDRSGSVRVGASKGRKQREVPLNASARRALKLYLGTRQPCRGEEHLFLSERDRRPLALRTIQATISGLARRAKITRLAVSAQSLRHSFALRFLRRNPGQLVQLAALLGHESLDTTAVHCAPSAEELAAGVEEEKEI